MKFKISKIINNLVTKEIIQIGIEIEPTLICNSKENKSLIPIF